MPVDVCVYVCVTTAYSWIVIIIYFEPAHAHTCIDHVYSLFAGIHENMAKEMWCFDPAYAWKLYPDFQKPGEITLFPFLNSPHTFI